MEPHHNPRKKILNAAKLACFEKKFPQQFLPLELVTKPNLTTRELAHYTNMAEQSWRVKACYGTFPEGLAPLRICGKLNWPTAGAKKLVGIS